MFYDQIIFGHLRMAKTRCKMEKKLTTYPPNTKFNTNISVVFTFPCILLMKVVGGMVIYIYFIKYKINSLKIKNFVWKVW